MQTHPSAGMAFVFEGLQEGCSEGGSKGIYAPSRLGTSPVPWLPSCEMGWITPSQPWRGLCFSSIHFPVQESGDSYSHLLHPHPTPVGPQEPSLWTETSLPPLGIWQDHVSNLWNTWYQPWALCTTSMTEHTFPNFCLIHFCQSLLSLLCNYLCNFHWKTGHNLRNLNDVFQTWMVSTQRKPEGSPCTQTHPKSLGPQTCCEVGALVFLHQQTESPSNTVRHQPPSGHSLLEIWSIFPKALSVTQSKNSLRTISRTALKIVCTFPESSRLCIGWRSQEERTDISWIRHCT